MNKEESIKIQAPKTFDTFDAPPELKLKLWEILQPPPLPTEQSPKPDQQKEQ